MSRILKVFATGSEQSLLSARFTQIEAYEGFVLLEVSDKQAQEISRDNLVEDITSQYVIPLRGGPSNALGKKAKGKPRAARGKTAPDKGRHHYLVQFVGPIKRAWIAGVKKTGGEPREPFGGFTYVVRADESVIERIRELPYVRWVGHLPHADRIAETVSNVLGKTPGGAEGELPRTKTLPDVFTVEFFDANDARLAVAAIKKLGFQILGDPPYGKHLKLAASSKKAAKARQIKGLSAVHGVRTIRERSLNRPSNDVAAAVMGTHRAMSSNGGLGLSGKGEVIGVCDTGLDTGDATTIHADFRKRVVMLKSYPITSELDSLINNPRADDGPSDLDSGHGTHVAGSVLGSGADSMTVPNQANPIRGLSHTAKLVFQAVEQETRWKNPADLKKFGRYGLWGLPDDLKDLFQDAYQKKVRIHSNSWGGGKAGEYGTSSQQLDQFVWDHKDFCILVAAGNDGTDKDGDGRINPMSVTAPGTAKNCITIGASESRRPDFNAELYGDWWSRDYPVAPFKSNPMANNPEQMAAFSSRGPTKDGRFKPDVCAPGTFILSARSSMLAPNNNAWAAFPESRSYFFMGGTSMATPLASGAVGLLREYLRKHQNIKSPTAALLKAALIVGAIRLPRLAENGAVVDNHQGYGRIHIDAVVAPDSPATAKFLDVKNGLSTGKISARDVTIKSNALPLRIVLAYSDFPGPNLVNNLNLIVTAPDGKKFVGNQPVGSPPALDTQNNVELVVVPKPAAGAWKIEVVASNVAHGPQDFALVWIAHQ